MYSGTGAGGCIFPLVVDGLLRAFGYKATMVSLGIAFGIIGSISILAIRRRIPLARPGQPGSERGRRPGKLDWSFCFRKYFIAGVLTITLTSLGNFVPSLWLPSKLPRQV
jgi:hypothetical protein